MKNKALSLLLVATLVLSSPFTAAVTHAENSNVTMDETTNTDDKTKEDTYNNDGSEASDGGSKDVKDKNGNSNVTENTDDVNVEKEDKANDKNIGVNSANGETAEKSELELNTDDKTDNKGGKEMGDDIDTDLTTDQTADNTVARKSAKAARSVDDSSEESNNVTTGSQDITAPTLKNIILSQTDVNAPSTIDVTVEADDDVSGVASGYIIFVNSDNDSELRTNLNITDDGNLQGKITVSEYTGNGDYHIESMSVVDKAGNSLYLYGSTYVLYDFIQKNYPNQILDDNFQNITLTVKNVEKEDVIAPQLVDINLNKTNVEASNIINVTVEATDEGSGVSNGYIIFVNSDTSTTLRTSLNISDDGKLHGEINVSEYTGNGNYRIESMSVVDKAGNSLHLYGSTYVLYDFIQKNYPEEVLDEKFQTITFTVNNDKKEDIIAPQLININLSKTNVEAPNTIYVTVEAVDEGSGLSSGYIIFVNSDTKTTLRTNLNISDNGSLTGIISISQYTGNGNYRIESMSIVDKAGNSLHLYGSTYVLYDFIQKNYPEEVLDEKFQNITLTVTNIGKTPDITTSTDDENLLSQIESVSNDGVIVADYSSKSEVSKDVFKEIEGTNKIITFTSDGISWQFEGSKMNDNKEDYNDVDLSVTVTTLPQENSDNAKKISELVGNKSAVVLRFADNGPLPGVATIRMKADYALCQYLGTTGLQVYYYDSENNELIPIASNVSLTADNNIVFEIEHCSDYIVTGKTIGVVSSNGDSVTYSSEVHDENGNEVDESTIDTTTYTPEERTRMSFVGREKINAVLGIENKYAIMIQNSVQGPKCIDVFNYVKGEYTIGRTYNIFPDKEFGTHSKDTTAKITLTIPQAIYSPDRTYEMICVGANGMPYILEDLDDNPATITFETSNFYAFALCYK